jgi:pimeloyl-ACP methyl ester carboxylesterase
MHFSELIPSWKLCLGAYFAVEVAFYFVFKHYFIPKANQRTKPRVYRGYETQRHRLLTRILDRLERTSAISGQSEKGVLNEFLLQWFHKTSNNHPPRLQRITSQASSPYASDDEQPTEEWTDLHKEDMDSFFAWAFFSKEFSELEPWERVELNKLFDIMQERFQLKFSAGKSGIYVPRRLNLEDVSPMHRPLLVYVVLRTFERLAGVFLRLIGFRIHKSKSGLVYWHRAGRDKRRLPLLFFHGIAPGGQLFYLPMVLSSLGSNDRTMFLFENRPISSCICFHALTEDETIDGVAEALDAQLENPHSPVTLCGHSFGSCPITWLLHSSLRSRIQQVVLIDPVTILLSEPDVMINFVYSRKQAVPLSVGEIDRTKIQLVAGSELFTEYYLRRHFSWYNSELWLEDIPDNVQVLVCISEHDEIISAPKVKKEIEIHNSPNLRLIHWEGVGHANCIATPESWTEIRTVMMEQEHLLSRSKSD